MKGDPEEWKAWGRAAPESALPLFDVPNEEGACLLCGGDHFSEDHLELEITGRLDVHHHHHDEEED